MIIKNFEQLATTSMRKQCLRILESGLESINTQTLVENQLSYDLKKDELFILGKKYPLKPFKRVVVVGAGKMVAEAAKVVEQKMLTRIDGGIIIDIVPVNLKVISSRVGTHPLPSSANVSATQEIIKMLENLDSDDLVISIIGGGGSSLLCSPKTVTIDEERKIITALMDAGSSIIEMNTVRKHLSDIKGGGLAKFAHPATVISLIFSDVPGDDISQVASGPTVLDETTIDDAKAIMDKYKVLDRCNMEGCGMGETPKEPEYFVNVHNILFCSSKTALETMQKKAHDLGVKVRVWDTAFSGEASNLAKKILNDVKQGECLIGAGESVVTIHSTHTKGSGGRNQEMAIAALSQIPEGVVFASLASDGRDNSDVAGAMVDSSTKQLAKKMGIDIPTLLSNHDEYQAVLDLNSAIMTGITGSNVSDLVICMKS